MKSISFFPSGNMVATLNTGDVINATSFDEMGIKLAHAGVTSDDAKGAQVMDWSSESLCVSKEYSTENGDHLFTDRGNLVTFDQVTVTDKNIRLALLHARTKFGNTVRLTGDDPIFTRRMEIIAGEMGLTILH